MARRAAGRGGGRRGPAGGIARQGQLYWSNRGTSRGKRSGIPWGKHGKAGDFYICVARLRPHLKNPEGYCAKRHHEATGKWPGRHGRARTRG